MPVLGGVNLDIILIGPMGAGKSTVGKLLAARLGIPQVSLDDVRKQYYAEIGYDDELAKRIRAALGLPGVAAYWKQFDAHSVERVLAQHPHCVIDFGAGASVYEEGQVFRRVQRLLAPYENVVLLLPSPDLDESVRILVERMSSIINVTDQVARLIEQHVKHPSNHSLAKWVVYTHGKTPDETCEEIFGRVALGKGERR
jgi:adenylate kinase family enzyme